MHVHGWRVALLATAVVMTGCSGGGNAAGNPTPPAGQVIPPASESVSTAQIAVSGSTNTKPITIAVTAGGLATVTTVAGTRAVALPASTTTAFFSDIAQAQPLGGLPASTSCAKPVSFATTTTVSAGNQVTPDLSCPSSALESNLRNDVDAIVTLAQAS
jgi:hypothetical protein